LFMDVVTGRVKKYLDWLAPVYQREAISK
jgi:hypothetical protein